MSNIIGTEYLVPATADLTGLSNNPVRRGDYIGFTFGDKHSSELGIVRVSDGSRFQETLLPEFSNKTVNVPGSNRTDYMGMEYTQKPINLNIAFDSVTEKQLREIQQVFSTTIPKPLIFDETPYKTYYVKASAPPTFTYLCFDETQQVGEPRIYKGEGTISLISFFPYGFTDRWFLVNKDNYINDKFKYENAKEWYKETGLVTSVTSNGGDFNNFCTKTGLDPTREIWINEIYNPGDFDTTFSLIIKKDKFPSKITIDKAWSNTSVTYQAMELKQPVNIEPEDTHIIFNGKNQLIEGCKLTNGKYVKTGNIYNKYIKSGDWFVFPSLMGVNEKDEQGNNIYYYFRVNGDFSKDDMEFDYKILYI